MNSIDKIRTALETAHSLACGHRSDTGMPYMSIPANVETDADLILSDAVDELDRARADLARLQARVGELEAAVNWAMGCNGAFPTKPIGAGQYHWRSGLSERAGMIYDPKLERYVAALPDAGGAR